MGAAWRAATVAALLGLHSLCGSGAAPSECERVCARFHLVLDTFYYWDTLIPPAEREGEAESYAMRMAMADCRGYRRFDSVVGCPPDKLLRGMRLNSSDNAFVCMMANYPDEVDCCDKYSVCQ